jgi:hypothetical protein
LVPQLQLPPQLQLEPHWQFWLSHLLIISTASNLAGMPATPLCAS